MTEADNLSLSRKSLFDFMLDECRQPSSSGLRNWGLYTDNLRSFIVGKLSKVELDRYLFNDLGGGNADSSLIPLHNAYLASILNAIRADKHSAEYIYRMNDYLPGT